MSIPTRAALGVVAAAITGAVLFGAAPSALADPPPPPAPGCSAADFEQLKGVVSTATADYFFTHPDANAFFSTLKGQPREQVKKQVDDYFAANPQTKSELDGIRQPIRDMKARCS